MAKERNYKLDNLRFLLIYLVVFGHFLALQDEYLLYRIIYSFHMPALIFLSGYFAKYERKKILAVFVYTYVLFQVLYQLFDVYVLQSGEPFDPQFTSPYWLLWYLVLLIFYYLMIPLFSDVAGPVKYMAVAAALVLALVADFDATVGSYLVVSRYFTFMPYFVVGFYIGHREDSRTLIPERIASCVWTKLAGFVVVAALELFLRKDEVITPVVLYGEQSYRAGNYGPGTKFLLMLIAASWIVFLLLIVPDKKIPLFTALGQHTMPVYLLHGFLILLADKYSIFGFGKIADLILAAVLAFLIVVILGNACTAAVFERIFTGKWIVRAAEKF